MNKKSLIEYVLYELPLHFVIVFTSWLPDHPFFCKIRGLMAKPFIGTCGKNFQIGTRVRIMRPKNLIVGDDVYIAEGCWLSAAAELVIGDEVLFGPNCRVLTNHHGRLNGSFRHAKGRHDSINVGSGAWIGAHAVLTPGAIIGAGCLIGANTVVSKRVKDNTLVKPAAYDEIEFN